MISTLIRNNRTCRRFRQDQPVAENTLRELVDLARCSPSAGNLQPLKYIFATTPETNAAVFSCLGRYCCRRPVRELCGRRAIGPGQFLTGF